MRKKIAVWFILAPLLGPALGAQQYNSVPLGHTAYNVIEMGILLGAVTPPPSAKPWSELTVREKLREMLGAPEGVFSRQERDIVSAAFAAFERKPGIDLNGGRYRSENSVLNHRFSFELGLNWESDFSLKVPEPAIGTVNMGKIYLAGDMGEHFSWNFNIRAGFFSVNSWGCARTLRI